MTLPQPSDPGAVFERHRREVYGWAYRFLGRHHDALDAAQDVFLRWLAQSRRALPENPRGWLRQVTINRAIDLLRRRRTRKMKIPNPPLTAPTNDLEFGAMWRGVTDVDPTDDKPYDRRAGVAQG